MNIEGKLSGIANEMHLICKSYKGDFRCRREYNPEDLDHVISDLVQIRNALRCELKQVETKGRKQ